MTTRWLRVCVLAGIGAAIWACVPSSNGGKKSNSDGDGGAMAAGGQGAGGGAVGAGGDVRVSCAEEAKGNTIF